MPTEHTGEEPTTVTLTGTGNEVASAGHLVIRTGAFSKATVVLRYEGTATFAENVEVVLGDGAELTVVSVQRSITVPARLAPGGDDSRLVAVPVQRTILAPSERTVRLYDGRKAVIAVVTVLLIAPDLRFPIGVGATEVRRIYRIQ